MMEQQDTSKQLRKTVLHSWHVNHGAKMVEFGGWDMPVQYQTGIIQEHLATRRQAGLFDVSHMGRFRIKGTRALPFLLRVLTNNARTLNAGEAQYTFIANERGGALDDAYLYKLADDDYLLVVNAGNRDKDWQWLSQHSDDERAQMTNISEELAMISLQGPSSSSILEQLVNKRDLPENKRNRLCPVRIDGRPVIVARTTEKRGAGRVGPPAGL